MRNKKIISIFFLSILLISFISTNSANAVEIKEKDCKEETLDKQPALKKEAIIRDCLINKNGEVHWEKGFCKVSTKGKGLSIIVPMKIINVNAPVITPQYDRFFPLRLDNFATFFVYNDENATTIIEQEGKETIYINGSHSIFMGLYKLQPLHLLRMLLQDGIIDGFQRFQKNTEYGKKGPIAEIISRFINKTFGGPIIDISNETYEFLDYIKGTFPRANLGDPILDSPNAIKFRKLMAQIFGENLSNSTILPMIRLYAFMFPSVIFWNRMPVRTSILQFEKTMMCQGYSPFVRWTKSPSLQPLVQSIQDAIPDIIHDEPVEFKKYGD